MRQSKIKVAKRESLLPKLKANLSKHIWKTTSLFLEKLDVLLALKVLIKLKIGWNRVIKAPLGITLEYLGVLFIL